MGVEFTGKTGRPRVIETLEEKLIRFRSIDPITGCWNWIGSLLSGYGQINIDKKILRAHRISAHLYLCMDLDSKLFVCHKCDNKKCFNPEHLFIGTAKDNMQDMIKKGRKCSRSKLSKQQILEVQEMFKLGVKREILKNKFNVSYESVCKIIQKFKRKENVV